MVEHHADLGIAFDGDGDRVMMVDHSGAVVDGDELLSSSRATCGKAGACKAVWSAPDEQPRPGLAQELHIPFGRAKVGDRYAGGRTAGSELDAGRENSGHYRSPARTPTGDAIIAALRSADGAQASRPDPGRGAPGGFAKYPQVLINALQGRSDPAEHPSVKEASVRVTEQMGGRGRVLLRRIRHRAVGRVMVEGDGKLAFVCPRRTAGKIVSGVCA
ncbi:hypothetical protein ACPA9J_21250 [Pseudomonas aeruginosa]